jgi:hypothetical protein
MFGFMFGFLLPMFTDLDCMMEGFGMPNLEMGSLIGQ